MNTSYLGAAAAFAAMTLGACNGSDGTTNSPTSPTAPSPPTASAICSPPVVTVCTIAEAPNDGRTSVGQVTVTAGGAPSCRVAVGEAIPITFTIVRPNPAVTWEIETSTRQSASPSSGSAGTAGPFQATVRFTTFGGDNRTDDTIRIKTTGGLSCEFPIHGRN